MTTTRDEKQAEAREAAQEAAKSFAVAWLSMLNPSGGTLSNGRLLRLSLFQLSVGLTMVLLGGTLNRVMAVELDLPLLLIGAALSVPLLFGPLRILVGHRSDKRRSALGWRRTPFIWIGTLLQFGGLTLMPASLIVSSQFEGGSAVIGNAGLLFAFGLAAIGMLTVQTAGLALACDLVPEERQPAIVSILQAMLFIGMIAGAVAASRHLAPFSQLGLIEVLNFSALIVVGLNVLALWRQEPLRRGQMDDVIEEPVRTAFSRLWRSEPDLPRLLVVLAIGTAAFGMQDVLLEPFGAEVFAMTVAQTTLLTALFAAGALAGFVICALLSSRSRLSALPIAALGLFAGVPGFVLTVLATGFHAVPLFQIGVVFIGLGSGLFGAAMLLSAMATASRAKAGPGLVLGLWSTVAAMALGIATLVGAAVRDFGAMLPPIVPDLSPAAAGYTFAYHIELFGLFAALACLGRLIRPAEAASSQSVPLSRSA